MHTHALTSFTKAHTLLIQKLDTDIVASDEDFLQHAEKRARKLAAPLSEFIIRSEQRGSDGMMRSEKHVVRELVERAEKKLTETEKEMEGLWREWVESEEGLERVWEEVSKEMDEMKKGKKAGKKNEDGKERAQGSDKLEVPPGLDNGKGEDLLETNGDDGGKETRTEDDLDEKDVLAKYEEAIQEEIEKAEEEVTELTNLTYQMMRDLEKVNFFLNVHFIRDTNMLVPGLSEGDHPGFAPLLHLNRGRLMPIFTASTLPFKGNHLGIHFC